MLQNAVKCKSKNIYTWITTHWCRTKGFTENRYGSWTLNVNYERICDWSGFKQIQWNFIHVLFMVTDIFSFEIIIFHEARLLYRNWQWFRLINDSHLICLIVLECEVFLTTYSSCSFVFSKNKWIWFSECISYGRIVHTPFLNHYQIFPL